MQGVASGASAPAAYEDSSVQIDSDGRIQDDTLGELNERFTMLKQFSTNTKTTVYLARALAADDPAAAAAGGQNVVIKILAPAYARPEDSSQPPNEVQIAEVSRFRREYQRLSCIDHPNVVRYVSFGLLDGWRPYMILEAISGSDVQRILDKKRWLTETETVGIVRGVLKALSALHLQGIIHRDIKPANIMVTVSAPFVKLIDFGFARMLEADGEIPPEENKIIGTPMYWAPEQTFARNTVTGALDLWAVGVLMFHLSSGVLPFSSHNGKLMQIAEGIRTKPARDLSAMTDGRVSPRFCVLCHRLLSKDKSIRPQTADEVLANLIGINDSKMLPDQALEGIAARLVSVGKGSHSMAVALSKERDLLQQLLDDMQSISSLESLKRGEVLNVGGADTEQAMSM